uniref:Uncharacterized protein n=1 Tax=Tetraselmis sp. GSL018 TaxID=582737 RepID=A0A061SN34_9CHLO
MSSAGGRTGAQPSARRLRFWRASSRANGEPWWSSQTPSRTPFSRDLARRLPVGRSMPSSGRGTGAPTIRGGSCTRSTSSPTWATPCTWWGRSLPTRPARLTSARRSAPRCVCTARSSLTSLRPSTAT